MKLVLTAIVVFSVSFSAAAETKNRAGIEKAFTKDKELIGYRVRYIGDNPELEKANIQQGDILQSVCGVKLINMQAYIKADQALMRGDKECQIVFLRDDQRQIFTLEAK